MIPFYIVTCDKTSHILRASCYLYNKYWPDQKFCVLGNNPVELPENFSFVKVKDDDDPRHWAKDLYKFIEGTKDEWFVLSLDDLFLNTYADKVMLDTMFEYAYSKKVGRMQLVGLNGPHSNNEPGFIQSLKQDVPYRLSCQTSVWNREYFLKYFNHNWTPWDVELRGSKYAWNDGYEIIGSSPSVLGHGTEGALSSLWPGKVNVRGLRNEDLEYFLREKILSIDDIFYYGTYDPKQNTIGGGMMNEGELAWLYDIAKRMDNVVEIGSWIGRSTHALLSGCAGIVYSVDHFQGSADPIETGNRDVYPEFIKNVGHFKNLEVRRVASPEAADLFEDNSIDLVFIDGGHQYQEVVDDINAWLPKAKRILAGHDYQSPAVAKAVYDVLGDVEVVERIWYKEL